MTYIRDSEHRFLIAKASLHLTHGKRQYNYGIQPQANVYDGWIQPRWSSCIWLRRPYNKVIGRNKCLDSLLYVYDTKILILNKCLRARTSP